jgi:hypothetical protein
VPFHKTPHFLRVSPGFLRKLIKEALYSGPDLQVYNVSSEIAIECSLGGLVNGVSYRSQRIRTIEVESALKKRG